MIKSIQIAFGKKKKYSDVETVKGLADRNREVEEWFYRHTRSYYYEHFNEVFFDKDRKQEIFQAAFLKLWMEIANGRIRVEEETLFRQNAGGQYQPMTCSLTTFLMCFAKNENREILRNCKEDYYAEMFDDMLYDAYAAPDDGDAIEEEKRCIVDECIGRMSPHCIEILTLFYYQEKSLDEILAIRKDKNTNKNGLKSAKTKCMSSLKEQVTMQFRKCNIYSA